MITEDYVSFEIAKLLKEKGFDEVCEMFYCKPHEGYMRNRKRNEWRNSDLRENMTCTCPTLQMTMKWLRETHNIHPNIVVEVYGSCATYMIDRIFDGNEEKWVDFKSDENPSNLYSKREEACEMAIKYCLENLI